MKGGVGETDINLSHLLVDAINLETGVGKIALTLPVQDKAIAAKISGGIGKSEIVVPAGCSGDLVINGGVGEVKVTVSPQAALRLSANAGLGKNRPAGDHPAQSGQRRYSECRRCLGKRQTLQKPTAN